MTQDRTDAWIFLSVARSDGGELAAFFSAADHIEVAIPTDAEIEGSLRRLVPAGLVDASDGRFALTSTGRALFDRVGGVQAFPRDQPRVIAPVLMEALRDVVPDTTWSLDPERTRAARGEYDRSTRRGTREMMRKTPRPKD